MVENNNYENIILFDGICNLCNASVKFILKNEKKQEFKFVAQQSTIGQKILAYYSLDNNNLQSFVYLDTQKAYTRSTAALKVVKKLKFPFYVLSIFIVIPKFFRDYIYDIIATKRYGIFGKNESCLTPSKEYKTRFL